MEDQFLLRRADIYDIKALSELVVYAVAGPCDDIPHPDVCSNQDGQLKALFIRRDHRNHGFGKQFMNLALPWLDEHYPGRLMWLTVWSGNFKAQKFYAYYDFNKVGEFDYPVGQWKDLEFIMKRQRPTL